MTLNPTPEEIEFGNVVNPNTDLFAQAQLSSAVAKGMLSGQGESQVVTDMVDKMWDNGR